MKPRVLFVDDEPAVLAGLRRMLRARRDAWDMEFASDAHDALARLAQRSFDAVVSDVKMPGMDGFELLATLQGDERWKDLPVVILTGAREADLKRRALDLGAADLLDKPVVSEDLVARLRGVLRLKASQDELKRHNETLERKVEERTAELADSRLEIIWRLGKAAEFRDADTGNHVVRAGCYSRVIAESLGLDREVVELIFLAGPLHDIGKIGIPDGILLKRGPLTDEEWVVMRRHCAIGAEILRQDFKLMEVFQVWRSASTNPPRARSASDGFPSDVGPPRTRSVGDGVPGPARPRSPVLELAASIALAHHERWDGSGYPSGLAGEAIPLAARIVAVVDVFDALCSVRPYKPARPEREALEIMDRAVGSHFDPQVHTAFRASLESIRALRRELTDAKPGATVMECLT